MDNITPLMPSTDAHCIVTIIPFQNAFYHQSSIEVQSPDGVHLETVGCEIQREKFYTNNVQLRDQIYLVESLNK